MIRADAAKENMTALRMNCAQSVLTAFCEELGLDKTTARKIAMGFGGGMGMCGKTCGAVTGSYMVIGLKQDLKPETAVQTKDRTYALVREFNQKFCRKNGSTTCKDLLGLDPSTPEGLAAARQKNLFTTICPQMVYDAVKILEEMNE